MKVCSTIPVTTYRSQFTVIVNRNNICQWFWGFAHALWRGDSEIKLNLYTKGSPTVFDDGKQVYPVVADSADAGATP